MKLEGSRLGKGSDGRGRLSGSGRVEIEGRITGRVDWSGLLVIGPDGLLEANGRVHTLEVRGVFQGGVEVEQEVIVRDGAQWWGGCAAPAMVTEAGAWFEGEFRIRPAE